MGLIQFLKRNETDKNTPWEETPAGKKFSAKIQEEALQRQREKEYIELTVPAEKREQVMLFKIIMTPFAVVFFIAAFFAMRKGILLWVLLIEAGISLVSLALFFIKPKFVKYPNCFMMPLLAFACVAMTFLTMAVSNKLSDVMNGSGGRQETVESYDYDEPLSDDFDVETEGE